MNYKAKEFIAEEFRISIGLTLRKFHQDVEQKDLEFPSSFTSSQRAYIHRFCARLGFKSKSKGSGATRYVTIYKKEGSTIVQAETVFRVNKPSQYNVVALLQRFPLSSRERQDLMPPPERDRIIFQLPDNRDLNNRSIGRLSAVIPQVPPCRADMEALPFQQSLPIWNSREEIIQSVIRHQVVLISGETGCGKTTQVPQYILDHCGLTGIPCRIICTQPRRLAAIALAERVSLERGEKLGLTIGYQIRLESQISPKTLLTFCTSSVLLRTLMCGDSFSATVTHVIVDELHERDKYSDFLLVILRDMLLKFRNIKLVLMSASLDTQLFVKYFGGCPLVEVGGRLFDVKPLFLEDIIKSTGFVTNAMKKYKSNLEKVKSQQEQLQSWCLSVSTSTAKKEKAHHTDLLSQEHFMNFQTETFNNGEEVDPVLAATMDKLLYDAWMSGSKSCFSSLINLLLSHNIPIDWQHRETSLTPLMVAAARGGPNAVEQLLILGASIDLQAANDWNALDFAKNYGQPLVGALLESHCHEKKSSINNPTTTDSTTEEEMSADDKVLLDSYQHSIDQEKIDVELIFHLIRHISLTKGEGAVLVFLPGYDDIVLLRDKILFEEKGFPDHQRLIVFTLHSQMQNADLKRVFKPVPHGVRKIILSTSIAETSITVNDVVFVVDCGKIKEKSFDALVGTSQLLTRWISQSTAAQRRGRAGRCRPGICYHLFSQDTYNSLQKSQIPEILRVPIHELCLQAKLLAPPNVPIADFLARAPDPPPFMVTRNAVTLLKTIDALDTWEELTELGLHLLDLPVEPRLGKMLMYSVVLKCLDPIMTIVCALSYRDPFLIPSQPSQRKMAVLTKKKLSCNTYSDHLALLRAYQMWHKAKTDGCEPNFCTKNFLSASTMEMIAGMRMQLLGQLRASGFVKNRGVLADLRELNVNSDVWPIVRAAILAGTYPNLIRIDRERSCLVTQKESKVRFHPSSVLSKFPSTGKESVSSLSREALASLPSDWLVYEELSQAGHYSYAHCCTLVTPVTVALFSGSARLPLDALHDGLGKHNGESDSEDEMFFDGQRATLKIDDWIAFKIEPEIARVIYQLRQKWQALFLRRMHMPLKQWTQMDEAVVRTITAVLVAEEEDSMKFPRPSRFCVASAARDQVAATKLAQQNNPQQMQPNNFRTETDLPDVNRLALRSVVGQRPEPIEKPRAGLVLQGPKDPVDHSSMSTFDTSSVTNSPSGSPSASCERYYRTPSPVRFYIIKAPHPKTLDISLYTGTWAFSPQTEKKLLGSIKEGKETVLIFSLQGSGHFQGIARFTPRVTEQKISDHHHQSGRLYHIEWLKRANIPFQTTRHLHNSWNDNKKVQISRDGQELEPSVGEALCKLWDGVPRTSGQTSVENVVNRNIQQSNTSSASPWFSSNQRFDAPPNIGSTLSRNPISESGLG